ncbi:MAG: hypothetical protein OSJ70_10635 [Bacilli bacterium]|nr:hypothetical protein [Bacilli bacterium]
MEVIDVIKYNYNKSSAIEIQQKLYNISTEEAEEKCRKNNFENFIVIIVRIKHSIYIITSTHWGIARVEKHMYTLKNNLRERINVPFGIHSTINEEEAKHDVQIITGKDINYYMEHSR